MKELENTIESLQKCPLYKCDKLPSDIPKRGIVVFYSGGKPLHVGASKDTRQYIHDACFNPRGFLAPKLAKVKLGMEKASPNELRSLPRFMKALARQEARVRKATIRVLAVENDVQAALAKPIAVLLGVPHLTP